MATTGRRQPLPRYQASTLPDLGDPTIRPPPPLGLVHAVAWIAFGATPGRSEASYAVHKESTKLMDHQHLRGARAGVRPQWLLAICLRRGWAWRWFGRLETPALLLHFMPHLIRPPLDLALYFGAGVAYLAHGAPEGSRDTGDAFAPEEHQHDHHDQQQFTAANIEDQELAHRGAKVVARDRESATGDAPVRKPKRATVITVALFVGCREMIRRSPASGPEAQPLCLCAGPLPPRWR